MDASTPERKRSADEEEIALFEPPGAPSKRRAIGEPPEERLKSKSPAVYLVALVERLYQRDCDHPVFQAGLPTVGMPYSSERSNGQCWLSHMKTLGKELQTQGIRIGDQKCWLRTYTQFQHKAKKVLAVRALSFFKDPSAENWAALNAGIEAPFDHFCGNGLLNKATSKQCVNGIEHGEFSTREVNESRKLCTYGFAARCPGHGVKKVKCIFVHKDDGSLKPCLNQPDCVPRCGCQKPCF